MCKLVGWGGGGGGILMYVGDFNGFRVGVGESCKLLIKKFCHIALFSYLCSLMYAHAYIIFN